MTDNIHQDDPDDLDGLDEDPIGDDDGTKDADDDDESDEDLSV